MALNPKQEKKEKHAGGRPKKYSDVEMMELKIQKYFKSCWRKKYNQFGQPIKDDETGDYVMEQYRPYTICGLALALDLDRKSLLNYSKDDKFFHTIKKAKEFCEAYAEESLFDKGKTAGSIFNLINNYDNWSNRQDINQSTKIEKVVYVDKEEKEDMNNHIDEVISESYD